MLCNAEIKFKAFLDHALASAPQEIATGNYAGVHDTMGNSHLLKGLDPLKDQSYCLHRLNKPL